MDRHYIESVTATTHLEKGIITLESNPLRGTVLPAPHGKGSKWEVIFDSKFSLVPVLSFGINKKAIGKLDEFGQCLSFKRRILVMLSSPCSFRVNLLHNLSVVYLFMCSLD